MTQISLPATDCINVAPAGHKPEKRVQIFKKNFPNKREGRQQVGRGRAGGRPGADDQGGASSSANRRAEGEQEAVQEPASRGGANRSASRRAEGEQEADQEPASRGGACKSVSRRAGGEQEIDLEPAYRGGASRSPNRRSTRSRRAGARAGGQRAGRRSTRSRRPGRSEQEGVQERSAGFEHRRACKCGEQGEQ